MLKVNWIITDQNITVNFNGQTHILSRENGYAEKLISAIKEKRHDDIPNLVSAAKRIENSSGGLFTVKDGQIIVDGVVVAPCLGRKIEDFANAGLPFEPLVLFAKNLNKNPSYRATQDLYLFLEKNNHPITENGMFIAYKRVRPSFLDIHSETFDNSPGNVLEMPRNQVDEDPERTCSKGLHVANWDYAYNHFGGPGDIMLEVEVHPQDVVAIPSDYLQSKMRTCRYKVIGIVDAELCTPLRVVNPPVEASDDDGSDDYEEEDDYEEDENVCENCDCLIGDVSDYLCLSCREDQDEQDKREMADINKYSQKCENNCEYCEDCEEEYPWKTEIE